jgi:hypothetical protein
VARVQGLGEDLSATNTIPACAKHLQVMLLRKQVEITILWTLVSQLCRILFFLLLKQQPEFNGLNGVPATGSALKRIEI